MGADLSIAVEHRVRPGVWTTVAVGEALYRGWHSDVLRDIGREVRTWPRDAPEAPTFTDPVVAEFGGEIGGETASALKYADPYWVRWMPGPAWVAWCDANFGKVIGQYDEPFEPGPDLRSFLAMVRWLVEVGQIVRIVWWYGP